MAASVLFLDNDPVWVQPHVKALSGLGYSVSVVTSLSEAESVLSTDHIDLLMLDVMIPTMSPEEEVAYPPTDTDHGYASGLWFYQRNRDRLDAVATVVIVYTARLDDRIARAFAESGLPNECFLTRMDISDIGMFLSRVKELLRVLER